MPVVRERQKGREHESAGAADDVITFTPQRSVGRYRLRASSAGPRQNRRSQRGHGGRVTPHEDQRDQPPRVPRPGGSCATAAGAPGVARTPPLDRLARSWGRRAAPLRAPGRQHSCPCPCARAPARVGLSMKGVRREARAPEGDGGREGRGARGAWARRLTRGEGRAAKRAGGRGGSCARSRSPAPRERCIIPSTHAIYTSRALLVKDPPRVSPCAQNICRFRISTGRNTITSAASQIPPAPSQRMPAEFAAR
jgi:hypothetical protein